MSKLKLPNTFLIGVQKAATTSIFSWLAQHQNICGPLAVKDLAFFTRDDFYEDKGFSFLSDFYDEVYNNEDILLQGSVHYIFFEKALKRIFEFNPFAKFILILRNPSERAISAYEYALKFNYENLPINEAFNQENERLKSKSPRVLSELTYKHHGLYYKQIQTFLKYFKEEQLKVVLYEDVSNQPELVVKELFKFLNIEESFTPNFKALNITGEVKNKAFQKVVFGDNKMRNWFVHNVINNILPQKIKAELRWKMIHLNTNKKKLNYLDILDDNLKKELNDFYKEDINQLEIFLSKDLSHWKI